MAQSIPEMYGSLVFNDKVMRSKLPKDMYKALKKTIENGTHLELDVANSVAVPDEFRFQLFSLMLCTCPLAVCFASLCH